MNGIGLDWANKILAMGYDRDKREPMKTKAKVLDKTTGKMKRIVINVGDRPMGKCHWRGDMLK